MRILPEILKCINDGKLDSNKIPYMVLLSLGTYMAEFIKPMDKIYHGKGTADAIIATGLAMFWENHKNKIPACIESDDESRVDISFSSSNPDVFCAVFTGDDSIMNESACFWNMKKLLKYHETQYGKSKAQLMELSA